MFIPVHRQYPVPLVRQRPNWGDHLDLLGEFLLNLSQVFLPWSRLAGISSAWSCAHCVAHTFVAFVEHISLMTCTSMRACVCVGALVSVHTHTLVQNYPSGFWYGMHLTCKNTPIIPDRNGSMKGPEKFKKLPSPWAIAITRCKELEADPSLSTKPNRSHLDRLRKPCKNAWRKNKLFENGMAVLRLATSHDQKVKFRRYVGMISPNILPTHE